MAAGFVTIDENNKLPAAVQGELNATFASKGGMFEALAAGLDMGFEDIGLGLIGDSTGNAVDEWFYRTGQELATRYPTHTVQHRVWNDATQNFDRPTELQLGTAGRRALVLASTGTIAAAGYDGQHIGGDIDLIAHIKPLSWTGSNQTIISRFGASGDRAFRFQLNSSGVMTLNWSADGTNLLTAQSSDPVPFADGADGWVRVAFDVDDGASGNAAMFYTSTDGVTWTQLGPTWVTAGTTSIFDSTSKYEIGARTGTAEPLTGGRFYEVDIRDGVDGPSIAPRLPTMWGLGVGAGTPTEEGAPVVTLVNGSLPGADIEYLGEATRVKKLTPDFAQAVQFFSDSHNEQLTVGVDWINMLAPWVADVSGRLPLAMPILLTQNPRTAPADFIQAHGSRRRQTLSWGKAQGHSVIDIYKAFLDDPAGLDLLVADDGIHPTNTVDGGSILWADTITALIPK